MHSLVQSGPALLREKTPRIRLLEKLLHFYVRGYHSLRVLSPCRLPCTGPAILICNHISSLDPILIQAACPRLITWMMAREYYEMRSMKWFLDMVGAIPVERNGRDLHSTRAAFRALKAGRVLGIFPEGYIGVNGMRPFQTGAALLAMRSGAQVFPACVEGTIRGTEMVEAYLLPQRVDIAFGEAIELGGSDSSRQALESAALKMRDAVISLQAMHRSFPAIP